MRALPWVVLLASACERPPDLPAASDAKARVLVFVQTRCPVSNAYAPELKRLAEDYGPRGVAFVAVYAEPGLAEAAAREHATSYGYPFPHLVDPGLEWPRRAGARRVPEAALFTPAGELLYSGRIDDRYLDYDRARPAPTTRDLRAAIEAALSGARPAARRTEGVGCPIPFD